ncbi:MAG: DNRLRE domain-containing protein [Ignavibacteria bacterium]|nr:DNRLRE domain-containing protein [Ignavibacteria bacterium]
MINKNLKTAFFCIIGIVTLSIYTIGCADDPSELGLNFIPPGETTGVKIFDSFIDTMPITSQNKLFYVNTSGSHNLLVGKKGSIESKGLIKFDDIGDSYDSATVVSAKLFLYYRNYYFPNTTSDSLGQIGFDVYRIQEKYDFNNITYDSVTSNAFGTVSQGSYTGTPTADSQEVELSLNTSLVKDWLEYAADTSYSVKNYGIVLSPNGSSVCIKGFTSNNSPTTDLEPKLEVIYTKNGTTDTFSITTNSTISLSRGDLPVQSETFTLQAGISYVQPMKFDLSHIPSTATINDVQLFLALDSLNCIFSNQSNFTIYGQFINDSAGLKTDLFAFNGSPAGSGMYMMRLVAAGAPSPFARWLSGETNYGLLLFAGNQTINLDRYVFYNETASDHSKRPHVIIKYTPRVTP